MTTEKEMWLDDLSNSPIQQFRCFERYCDDICASLDEVKDEVNAQRERTSALIDRAVFVQGIIEELYFQVLTLDHVLCISGNPQRERLEEWRTKWLEKIKDALGYEP